MSTREVTGNAGGATRTETLGGRDQQKYPDFRFHAVDLGWSREKVLSIAEEIRGVRAAYRIRFADVRAFAHVIRLEAPGICMEWYRPGVVPVPVPELPAYQRYLAPRAPATPKRDKSERRIAPPVMTDPTLERKRADAKREAKQHEAQQRQQGLFQARR